MRRIFAAVFAALACLVGLTALSVQAGESTCSSDDAFTCAVGDAVLDLYIQGIRVAGAIVAFVFAAVAVALFAWPKKVQGPKPSAAAS